MDKKTKPLVIRITQKEKENLENACIKIEEKPNKSRLIRKIIREYIYEKPDLLSYEMEAFRRAVRNLTGLSRNLNQITKKINAGELKPDQLTTNKINDLQNSVSALNDQVKHYIESTVKRKD